MKANILTVGLVTGLFLFSACGGGQKKSDNGDSEEQKSAAMEEEAPVNALSEKEKEEGWELLFNGEDFEGWRGYGMDEVPGAWTIDDGAIMIQGSGEGEAGAEDGGDIIYDEQFKNFELKFDWKVSKGGNSGVFYLAQELEDEPIWRSAPEYQILDNENHPDARLGEDGNRKSASLYDLVPADPQNSKGHGEWNTGGILVYKGTVVHMQNGENVLEYHLWTPEWEEMIANSKFDGWEEMINAGGDDRKGYIGLQDHGDDVWFRNIKLKVME
ncbi:MAG: 3-keto-disaccharide hydrolase [Bacteroidota bacterium]